MLVGLRITGLIEKEEDRMNIKANSIIHENVSQRIRKVEEYSKIKFPDSYVDFIKKYNVGVPINNQFLCNKHFYAIERFLGFINEYKTSPFGNFDIAVVLSQIDTRLTDNPNLIGDELIPIASLFAGDYVCLDYRKSKKNSSICVWNHEESEDFAPVTYPVANNFSEFIEMLE